MIWYIAVFVAGFVAAAMAMNAFYRTYYQVRLEKLLHNICVDMERVKQAEQKPTRNLN